MKFTYDPEADALSIRLSNASFADSDEVAPGIIVDYDEEGQVIAVEMLDVTKRSYVEVELPNRSASNLQSDEYSQTARISALPGVAIEPLAEVVEIPKHTVQAGGNNIHGTSTIDTSSIMEKSADTH